MGHQGRSMEWALERYLRRQSQHGEYAWFALCQPGVRCLGHCPQAECRSPFLQTVLVSLLSMKWEVYKGIGKSEIVTKCDLHRIESPRVALVYM